MPNAHPPPPGPFVQPNVEPIEEALRAITFPISKRDMLDQIADDETILLGGTNVDLRTLVRDLNDDFFESAEEFRVALMDVFAGRDLSMDAVVPPSPRLAEHDASNDERGAKRGEHAGGGAPRGVPKVTNTRHPDLSTGEPVVNETNKKGQQGDQQKENEREGTSGQHGTQNREQSITGSSGVQNRQGQNIDQGSTTGQKGGQGMGQSQQKSGQGTQGGQGGQMGQGGQQKGGQHQGGQHQGSQQKGGQMGQGGQGGQNVGQQGGSKPGGQSQTGSQQGQGNKLGSEDEQEE